MDRIPSCLCCGAIGAEMSERAPRFCARCEARGCAGARGLGTCAAPDNVPQLALASVVAYQPALMSGEAFQTWYLAAPGERSWCGLTRTASRAERFRHLADAWQRMLTDPSHLGVVSILAWAR